MELKRTSFGMLFTISVADAVFSFQRERLFLSTLLVNCTRLFLHFAKGSVKKPAKEYIQCQLFTISFFREK
jgi:hypothetical protein